MHAEERDLPFGQIDGQVIGVFRHLVEDELTDEIRHRLETNHSVGLKLDRRIIEELLFV